MSAVDAIRAGRIEDALLILQKEVRQHPAEQKHRVFLFQLLVVMGQWDRALVQLNVAGELDVANLHMVHAYREALQCEALRQAIFEGRHTPLVFGEPEPWIARMVEALIRLQLGRIQKRIAHTHKIPFTYDDEVVQLIASRCTELESGGRMIDAILTNSVLPTISGEFLRRMMEGQPVDRVHVMATGGDFSYSFKGVKP